MPKANSVTACTCTQAVERCPGKLVATCYLCGKGMCEFHTVRGYKNPVCLPCIEVAKAMVKGRLSTRKPKPARQFTVEEALDIQRRCEELCRVGN